MIARITAVAFALTLVPMAGALADDVGGDDVIIVEETTAVIAEEPVTAPPPPYLELESTAIAAGIGARFGHGTLLVEGQEHPIKVRGLGLGDFGVARIHGAGGVDNLENISDIEGTYLAVKAGAAAGKGASALTMRNDKGVVITLQSKVEGVQLSLGAEGLSLELE